MLPLTLFELWVLFINHIQTALSADNFAVGATFFNRNTSFHLIIVFNRLLYSMKPVPGYFPELVSLLLVFISKSYSTFS